MTSNGLTSHMVERGSQSRVGTRSIRVEISGGFCYEDDLDSKDLGRRGNLNRSGFPTS